MLGFGYGRRQGAGRGRGMGMGRGMGLGMGRGMGRRLGFCRYLNYSDDKELLRNRLKEELVLLEERKKLIEEKFKDILIKTTANKSYT